MSLFDDLFYSGPMLAVFSDKNRLQRMLDFEAALASAEAECGLVPQDAAKAIAAQCNTDILDFDALREGAAKTGTLALPLVKQLTAAVQGQDAQAAKYVHWGATSQDVIDTGFMLQAREALDLVASSIDRLCSGLEAFAEKHAETIMAGRTWLQQAVPVTLGWKAAGWLDAMLRHRARVRALRIHAPTLQLGGAAGTMASLGADGRAVSEKLASTLGLAEPDIAWHTSRDRVGEIATALALVVATLGKIGKDVSLLMQTEVGEASEAAGAERGASSTMPQKRNPVACAAILAASIRMPGLAATVLSSMVQEHERGLGNWPAEWETMPEIFNLCAGSLDRATDLVSGLEVDTERMKANLDLTRGLIMAEAVSMALASRIGKTAAHQLVERASRLAMRQSRHLRDVLMEDEEVAGLIPAADLTSLFEPAKYLGVARQSIERVLHRASVAREESASAFIDLPEVRTRYRWDGSGDSPVLLLANGLGTNLTMWEPQIRCFSKHFRVLRYDQRGHGESSVPPGPYSAEQLGRDVIALLDALEIESCCFCGLSMGGMIGQWLGVNVPDRVSKLVLCNTAAKIGSLDSWNARIDVVLRGGVEAAVPLVLDRWFTPGFHAAAPEVVDWTRQMLISTSARGYVAGCAAVRDIDQSETIRGIRVKTLVVAGVYDAVTTPAEGRYLADTIAGASYVELLAAHLSNVEAVRDFNSAVMEFLVG